MQQRSATLTPGVVSTRAALWLLVVASTLSYLSMGCYAAVLPGYVLDHLNGTTTAVGVAMGATAAAAVVLRPLAGAIGDRRGRRPPALVGAAVLAAGSALLLGPGALAVVIAGRVLIGAGDALFITATMAWVVDAADPVRRGRAMATIGMSIWLGLALGPQLAVLAREHGGYDAVWGLAALAALLALVLVALVPAPPRAGTPGADTVRRRLPRGALLPAAAMLLAAYGNAVFEAFGIVHLTARGVSGGAGLGGAASVFSVIAVTTFVARFAGGVLCDRIGPRPVALAALVLSAVAYGTFASASSFAAAALGGATMGVALALLHPALGLMATMRVAPEDRGAGLGVYLASMDVAFGVGPLVGGLIVSATSSATALWSGAAVALLALPLVVAAAR